MKKKSQALISNKLNVNNETNKKSTNKKDLKN